MVSTARMKIVVLIAFNGLSIVISGIRDGNINPQACIGSYQGNNYKAYVSGNRCGGAFGYGNWTYARGVCLSLGSDLLTVKDTEKSRFVRQYILKNSFNPKSWAWLGLVEVKNGIHFSWVDGDPLDYEEWNIYEPSNDNHNSFECGEFRNSIWNDIGCHRNRMFICEKPLDVFPACPSGYISNTEGRKCVKPVYQSIVPWENAKAACQEDVGADLAVVSDEPYDEFINGILPFTQTSYWIGAFASSLLNSDPTLNFPQIPDFNWHDGRPLTSTYSNWAPNEPNDHVHYDISTTPACVFVGQSQIQGGFQTSGRLWFDDRCEERKGFICERDFNQPVFCPGDSWIFSRRTNRCYKVISKEMLFKDSRAACQKEGGDLVSLTDTETRNYVISLVDATIDTVSNYWIGLLDPDGAGNETYQWLDGTELSAADTPVSSLKLKRKLRTVCALLQYHQGTYIYDAKNCHRAFPAVCQKDASKDYPLLECPTGYTTHISDAKDTRISCLEFQVITHRSWTDAKDNCSSMGGELFGFDFGADEDDLIAYVKSAMSVSELWPAFWAHSEDCYVFSPQILDPGGLKRVRCKKIYPYVCRHWGNFRIMTNLTDLGILLRENSATATLHDGNGVGNNSRSIPLNETCEAVDSSELNTVYSWTQSLTHASITISGFIITHEILDKHKIGCLFPGEQHNCCIEATLNKPSHLSSPLEIEMNFPMDKLFCLCVPEEVLPTQPSDPIPRETFDYLSNITASKNDSIPPVNKLCPCGCDTVGIDFNPSPQVLTQMLYKIRKELEVEKETLSSKRNRKISAEDPRSESQIMGYIGIGLCIIPFCLLVAVDLSTFCQSKNKT